MAKEGAFEDDITYIERTVDRLSIRSKSEASLPNFLVIGQLEERVCRVLKTVIGVQASEETDETRARQELYESISDQIEVYDTWAIARDKTEDYARSVVNRE